MKVIIYELLSQKILKAKLREKKTGTVQGGETPRDRNLSSALMLMFIYLFHTWSRKE